MAAHVHGVPGEWARVQGVVFGLWPVFLGAFLAGFAIATWFVAGHAWGAILLAAAFAAIAISAVRGVNCVKRFYVGARGEERVAGMLARLPDRYHVFNDYVVSRVHVDHVVVGPAGVFAVETKCWSGAVTVEEGHILVDGRLPDRSPLRQVRREAQLVKAKLAKSGWDGEVTPVLAFASDTFRAHIAEVKGAVILNSSELLRSFDTERVVIPSAELARLVGIMESNS